MGLFCISGIEATISGWIPSYVVILKVMDKSHATIYGTYFWTMITVVRLISLAVPAKSSSKLVFFLVAILCCSVSCLALHISK